jgi:hypothetical protein
MFKKFYPLLPLSLLFLLSACMTPPNGLDLALIRPTAQKLYTAELHSLAEPIQINQMHSWEIKLNTPSGAPVLGAHIGVDGGMPQHGHGFPTRPRVTRELGEGRYLLEGMKFSMTGWWEIKLKIQAVAGNDDITFNTIIATAGENRK